MGPYGHRVDASHDVTLASLERALGLVRLVDLDRGFANRDRAKPDEGLN
jgi:hypothetical protein